MKKAIFCLLFFFSYLGEGTLYKHEEEISNSITPKRFRFFNGKNVKISGSAQIAFLNLPFFYSENRIFLIDLRREFHGFSEGKPICWSTESASNAEDPFQYNISLLKEVLEEKELLFLQRQRALSERELTSNLKSPITYIRIPVTNHSHPEERDIDFFIDLIRNLKNSDWIHFHCAKGKGRTTTFMAMTDMLYHSAFFSLEQILERQFEIGGIDLANPKDLPSRLRFSFLSLFYQYCLECANSQESWSSWLGKQKNIPIEN